MGADENPQLERSANEPPPRARTLIRQGAVYGLAGAMKMADVAAAAARGAVRGAREGAAALDHADPELSGPPDDPRAAA